MSALERLTQEHPRECMSRVGVSDTKCDCGADEAAAELAALLSAVDALIDEHTPSGMKWKFTLRKEDDGMPSFVVMEPVARDRALHNLIEARKELK